MSTISKVPFRGTPEQEQELLAVINELRDTPGNLVPVLQRAQDIYGYLPVEVQTIISNELKVPMEKVYGVSTFYSQFSLNPKGKYKIQVCLGTACCVKNSGPIYDKLQTLLGIEGGGVTDDGKFSLEACRCLGACGLAPAMMVNGEVYGRLTLDELPKILKSFE